MTEFEKKLWFHLRDRRFCNVKFRRQVPIGNYIVDFVCFEKRVIVELDGSGHLSDDKIIYDEERNNFLKANNYKVLHFWNSELTNNFNEVMDKIYKALS